MTRKKNDKKILCLEPQFHNVLICKKNDCRPFLEVMIEEPENVSRQNLGILVGIFQIDDRSEDSSYVVNYLISIIKKEYFSRTNRGPVENFEASLHKANLALAKLATHENISWIGKINALCAVIEKNNILLSQTGNASALLLRGTSLMEITELPDDKIDSNPLKTFQDVISGKIEKDDKLILTTKEIFDIFSLEEIQKSALKFSRENFIQFLNTALINELDQVATLVIDIDEKIEEQIEIPVARKIEEMNVFSQTAFHARPPHKTPAKIAAELKNTEKERQKIIQESEVESSDFVDEKTGHIYIKEPPAISTERPSKRQPIDFSAFQEKISDLAVASTRLLSKAGASTKKSALSFWQKSRSKIAEFRSRKKMAALDILEKKVETQIRLEKETEKPVQATPEITTSSNESKIIPQVKIKLLPKEQIIAAYSRLEIKTRTLAFWKITKSSTNWLKEKTADGIILILRKPTRISIELSTSLKDRWQKYKEEKAKPKPMVTISSTNEKKYPWETDLPKPIYSESETVESIEIAPEKKPSPIILKVAEIKQSLDLKKILPDFSRLKRIAHNFNQKQKISALLILFLLLVVPYFIANWESKPKEEPVVVEEVPVVVMPLEKDLNVTRIEKLDQIHTGSVTKIINLNNAIFALTETEINDLESKKSFPLPPDSESPELFFGMADLNLLFIIKNDQVTSLSPTTGKFQVNNLAFPPNGNIVAAKTYLTYVYLLDTSNNQIYRAPRADGGFGEKLAWVKDTLDLSNAKDMAINENIYIIDGQNISKLFQGKKRPFAIGTTATPISPNKLYAQNDSVIFYVLDKTNSRIIKLDDSGKILAQYYNPSIADATDFSVSEENNLVYISDKDGVKSFKMDQ